MRKMTALFLSLTLLFPLLTAPARAEEGDRFSLRCTSAVLMEKETGVVLYAKNEHERLLPASVTKVMTLLLIAEAVRDGRLSPEDVVTASPRAASMGGSQIWLKEGEQMTVAEMVKCVAVASANDCAVALAEHLCGSEEAFTQAMNRRAGELGMTDTHFTNCTGLFESREHYSCAYDIALMSRELLRHDFVRQYTRIWTDTIRDGAFGLTNTNKLVRYYPGCTGLKTGYTSAAGYCLAASAERNGTEYIAVILRGSTSQERFDAARTLLDYGFANYALLEVPEVELPVLPVEMGEAPGVGVTMGSLPSVLTEKAMAGNAETRTELPDAVAAPVEAGQELGTLRLYANGKELASVPLCAAETVARRSAGRIWLGLVRLLCGAEEPSSA